MTFNESNTIEAYLCDLLARPIARNGVRDAAAGYGVGRGAHSLPGRDAPAPLGWQPMAAADLPREPQEVFVEAQVRAALIRLNPEIAAQPERADEVLYRLRALVLAMRSDGLVKCNEEFSAWLRGERSMPFGRNHAHVTVRLIDFDDLENNQYVVTTQYLFRAGPAERRADAMLLVNGLPLVLIETKTPVRPSVSWVDAALQIHDDYEKYVPELFVCNVLSVATEGKELRFGAIAMPIDLWGPWRLDEDALPTGLSDLEDAVAGLLAPATLLDILANFTLFATDGKRRRRKIVCRYQQYEGANRIVARVLAGYPKKGLLWHFQGSGKSLLMVFAAQKLRMHPQLKNPTVLIVLDRIDLDAQISATFQAADIPNLVKADSRIELKRLLTGDTRKIIITTIFKFGPSPESESDDASPVLNDRHTIIALVDEAHRTQEGDLGLAMRAALPNAFLFGLTGTPINRRDRNTFYAFGATQDAHGYLSRYSFETSIRDGATLPLHFEPRRVELHIAKEALDQAFASLTGELSDLDRDSLGKAASRMAVLVKAPQRIRAICADIATHYRGTVEPNSFKAMVVTLDQECCLLYKAALDELLGADASTVVISVAGKDKEDARYQPYRRDRDAEAALLERFRDPRDPLKILIVTAKLLTGFDAPILQALYLDKPLRDHTLLQAICRTNRPYGGTKTHGLIIDYLGVFDDVATALRFDEAGVQRVVGNIAALWDQLPGAMQHCLAFFPGVDRGLGGYEGLIAAQDALPNDSMRDAFAADYSVLSRLWEALSPDPLLGPFTDDYRWLSQVYESLRPSTGQGALLWHVLGEKTIALIHEHVRVGTIHDDLADLVFDADVIEALLDPAGQRQKAREIEIKVAARLRRHLGNPRFKRLSERLEQLKARHEAGQLHSIAFLKELLDLARDLVAAEKETPPAADEDRGKAALTELFQEVRDPATPVVIARLVDDIDQIVRIVRFAGWQQTSHGAREVKKSLRGALFKYRLHSDKELFDKAYGYIKQYY